MKVEDLTYDKVKEAVEKAGFKFFTGPYNLNFIGIRSLNRKVDLWDDFFCCLFEDGDGCPNIWTNDQFTTDPGYYYMVKKLLNSSGCGILARGQHRGIWKIDLHAGRYKAYCQRSGPVTYYRDRNRDNIMDFDESTKTSGYVGCNMHHGYDAKGGVNNHSAMCQVHRYKKDLTFLLKLGEKQIANGYGETFTYTLLEEGLDF